MEPSEQPDTPPTAADGWWFDEPSSGAADADGSAPAGAAADPSGGRSLRKWAITGVGAAAIALASVVGINIASSHISSTATAATGQGALGQGGPGGMGGPGGPGGAMGAMGTSGAIATIDGTTLTVTTRGGTTKVTTSGSTTVTESVAGSLSDIAVGDTVMVRGSGSGTDAVTATEITDQGTVTADNAGGPPAGAPPAGQTGGPPPGMGGGMGGARGKVTAIDGSTLTVEAQDGTTVTVSTTDATTVSITKAISVAALTTGEQVRVIGSTGTDGTVAATRIMAGDSGFGGPPDLAPPSGSNGPSTPPTTT